MKFNEFKPQLTEEQIVLSYCKSEITKEDAVSQLNALEAVGDPEYREKAIARIRARKNKRNSNNSKTTLALQNYLISTGADIKADGMMGPKTTLALQKYLISQGADIKADGMMGPKTRAAMRAEMERINPEKDPTDNDEIITLEPDAGAEEDPMIQAILDKEKEARRLDNLIKDKERGGAPTPTPTPTVPTPGGGGVGKIQPAPVDPVDPVVPAPEPDKKGGSPGTFFGFPIDDPEGGSDAFFGGKTLPQDEYDKMFGGDGDNMGGGGNPQYRPDKDTKPTKPKPSKPTKPKPSKPRPTPSKPPRSADRTTPRRYNFPRPV
jgi:hypothetical protein